MTLQTTSDPIAQASRATEPRLEDLFRPVVERLSALLDRDFTQWCAQAG